MRRRIAILAVTVLVIGGAVAGVLALATGPGSEFLRVQTERILADLLEGEVRIARVELTFHEGLGLRGHDVDVYPDAGGYGMHADVAEIELREWGLAAADLELALLRVQGFALRATLDEQGVWSFPPLRALQKDLGPEPGEAWDEPVLATLQGFEEVIRFLLQGERIADTIVVESARVEFVDRSLDARMREGMTTQRFELKDSNARLHRPWLRGGGAFALAGTVVGPTGRQVDVTWTGYADGDGVHSTIETGAIDLDVLDGYVQSWSRQADVNGRITGRLRLDSAKPRVHQARVDAHLDDFVPTVVVDHSPAPLKLPLDRVSITLEASPEAARILDATAEGPRVEIGVEGRVERPVGPEALAHLDLRIGDADLEDVTPLIRQLPRQTVEALVEWFDRIESATVNHVGISGTARLSRWGSLAGGELLRLPRNFLMSLRVSDVTARLDENDFIRDAGFEADWTSDRMELRQGSGIWRGSPLAQVDLTVEGFSRLVNMQEPPRETQARPVPGVRVLWDLLLSGEPEADSIPTRFQVDVDHLEHPILRWPIKDARVVVTPTATGSEALVERAEWGGQPVVAEVLYQAKPTERIIVGLEAVDADRLAPYEGSPVNEALAEGEWGRGRFQLAPYQKTPDRKPDMLSTMSGRFRLSGSALELKEMTVELSSEVHAGADLAFDFAEPDQVAVDLTGRLIDTSCDALGQLFGVPQGFVTGTLDAYADVDGTIRREEGLLHGLRGTVNASARKGEIRKRVPLVVSLASATDGFNPFAQRDALEYDTLEARLRLQDGVLIGDRFEIEGPVRVYATGTLELEGEPQEIEAVVGVFLLQRMRELLGKVPLVSWVMPGSERGFVGAYFRVSGDVADPKVETMAMKTLREELPDVISAPLDVLEWLWTGGGSDKNEKKKKAKKEEKLAKKAAQAAAEEAKAAEPPPDRPTEDAEEAKTEGETANTAPSEVPIEGDEDGAGAEASGDTTAPSAEAGSTPEPASSAEATDPTHGTVAP